ncbi:tRNA lysidine(34) synthetase TilS [Alkaliphilus serpentinus]|uniref:tRNA(Ile)-lysidine synthase n=2 Tax=Alkaliphilus serpentinus TaxID=1482731 RepID=A0A833HRQ9_9FIRM|nr:tRNA lysidine(34) synthetase TilS [Alkaliphilus serpentinus]
MDKIKKTIDRYQLIEAGDRIVVAVSGGPDSVCLLHLLDTIKDFYNIKLYGAHLNHNFRGIEAQKDAQYVHNLCEEMGIMSFVKSVDVPVIAKEKGYTLEEAGRIMRYSFFDEVAEKTGANKIAVAHNLNDQAETLLMRLLRGTGIQGLTAIHHKRGRIIRPLLDTSREDIEGYCGFHNLKPRMDHTNFETIYHRNKIRLQLIPLLQEYNNNILETLAKTAEILKLDSDYIDYQAHQLYNQLTVYDSKTRLKIPIDGLEKAHPALQSRIFRLAVEALVGRREAIEYKHIQILIDFAFKEVTGKQLQLPMGITAIRSYDLLLLTTDAIEENTAFTYSLNHNATTEIDELDSRLICRVINRNALMEIPKQAHTKAIDYDKVKGSLKVRNRREGDRFWPLGLKGTKKLKDFFIDYKVPREMRQQIPLVCDDDEIIWVVGYRISEKYKITNETKRVLLMEYTPK